MHTVLTNITPLPSSVSRDVAVAHLHDHSAMIELNPLVIRHAPTEPPPDAAPDEAEVGTWYEITDRINYLPGGVIQGKVSYKACFYDLPRGLQTHVFAPGGVDIRGKWSIGGSMAGEPQEPKEWGKDTPKEGLYIQEDVDLRCSVVLTSFVKRNLKKSHETVAARIIERALVEERDSSERFPLVSSPPGPGESTHPHALENIYAFPSRCSCEGSRHDATCQYFRSNLHHGRDLSSRGGPARTLCDGEGKTSLGLPKSRDVSELYGSTKDGQCLCTGGLHDQGCQFYPGLRVPPRPGRAAPNSHRSGEP